MRCVLIIHPDETRRREIGAAMGEIEVLEAATREAALPVLRRRSPSLVVSHHEDFRRLLKDLDRHAPGAMRAVLCPRSTELRRTLVDVATQGYEFETLDEHEPRVAALLYSRRSVRKHSEGALTARFTVGDVTSTAVVADVGNDGLGLVLSPGPAASLLRPGLLLTNATVWADLDSVMEPGNWLVRSVRRSIGSSGVQAGVTVQADRANSAPTSAIDDAVQIRGLLRRATGRRAWFELQYTDGSLRRRFRTGIVVRAADSIALRCTAGDQPFRAGQIVRFSFEFGGEQFESLSIVLESDGEAVRVACPDQLLRRHRRSCLRAHAADGLDAHLVFPSPFDGTFERRRVLDLHPSGAAFTFSAAREAFPVGLVLREVVIEVSGHQVHCSATVRGTSPAALFESFDPSRSSLRRCGLQLHGLSARDEQLLRDVVVRSIEPAVAVGGSLPFESIWALFADEGANYQDYPFDDPRSLALLGAQHRRLGDGAHGLSKTFVYLQDGHAIGHASALRTHSRTWMSIHLVVRSGYHRAHRVSQSLVTLTFDYGESLPDVEYVKGLWRAKNRWASRIYGALTARLIRPGLSYLTSFTPMRRSLASPLARPALKVRRADRSDIRRLLEQLRQTEDLARLAAEDLTEEEATLQSIGARYETIGLQRSRSFGVVDGDRRPLGFVVIEHMSPGVFWVEMCNSFRMYLTDPIGQDADDVRHSLVNFAMDELRAHHGSTAECHAADLDLPLLGRLGFVSLGRMMEFGAHRSLIREMGAQMMGFFDRLDLRGELTDEARS